MQSLDAEQKKYRLGASTSANVLSQTRNLETAQDNLIAAQTTYAVDRATLSQLVADDVAEIHGINITDAATGNVSEEPNVPGPGSASAGSQAAGTAASGSAPALAAKHHMITSIVRSKTN